MPYIIQTRREAFDDAIFEIAEEIEHAGEFNYVVSKLAGCLVNQGIDTSYEFLNAVDGAIGLAQAEFRRRYVFPYEDLKMIQNGDLFDEAP